MSIKQGEGAGHEKAACRNAAMRNFWKTCVVDDFLQDRRHEPLPNNCSQRSEENF